MKILHVITSLRTGGAEKLMVDLLPRMRDAGHEVTLCVFDGIDTPFKQQLTQKGVEIIALGSKPNIYHPQYLLRLNKLISRGGYDIVHTHNTAPQIFAALSSIVTSQAMVTTEHNTSNRRRAWKWFAPIDRWMYSRYKSVVCISDKTETHLKEHLGKCPTKVVTIPNGIDITRYMTAMPFDYRDEYPSARNVIVQVAAFREQKDQDTTIRAMALLPDSAHLFLVGDGERRPQLEELVKQLGLSQRVHLLGVRTDVAELLAGADVAVMSSHWEGFGLAAVEAMAAGTPVVASDVDGLREVVNGAGLLAKPSDPSDLARQIETIINNSDKAMELAAAGASRAPQYGIGKMVKGYLNIYSGILQSSSKGLHYHSI
ncbi:MAG: glycosyltransferase [Pseudoflavonifractor sp.]|nr:glycosyltransferase [Alloprevotella sp.]MCM1116075.1 glycosyltransferase [Pseudoflavonifractor sp.]